MFWQGKLQPSQLPEPFINCTPRKNDDAWRFNYAIHKQITTKLVDVSGQFIPNNQLRIIPNRGIHLYAQERNLPSSLSGSLGNISSSSLNRNFTNNDINKNLTYTANRQKLTGQGMTQGYTQQAGLKPPAVVPPVTAAAALSTAGTPARAPRGQGIPMRPTRRPVTRNMGRA